MMKKYALLALIALTVSILSDLLVTAYFSDRVIVNPSQQFTLFMKLSGALVALTKFVSVAVLLSVGAIWLKRYAKSQKFHQHN